MRRKHHGLPEPVQTSTVYRRPSTLIALVHSFGNYVCNGAFDFHARENMPRELASATLYMNEGYVEGGGVHGRVDQVYQRADGALVVT